MAVVRSKLKELKALGASGGLSRLTKRLLGSGSCCMIEKNEKQFTENV